MSFIYSFVWTVLAESPVSNTLGGGYPTRIRSNDSARWQGPSRRYETNPTALGGLESTEEQKSVTSYTPHCAAEGIQTVDHVRGRPSINAVCTEYKLVQIWQVFGLSPLRGRIWTRLLCRSLVCWMQSSTFRRKTTSSG